MLKINASNYPSVANYIESYRVYADWYNSSHSEKINYLFSNDPDGIPVHHIFEDNLPDKVCNESSDIIFIDNSHENANTHKILIELPTEKFYIILSNGTWDSTYYPLPIKYLNLTRHMYFYEYISFVFNMYHIMFHNDTKYNFDYPKKYNFISTTGSVKNERDRFIDFMQKNLKTDNFIFRYSGVDLGKPASHYDSVFIEPDNFDSYTDIPGLEKYYYTVSYSLPTKMYNLAYYNLVVEGDIDWPYQFNPTEKIVKSLLAGMPFVAVSSPLFLEQLRNLGFKTYNEIWDETYDYEFNYDTRIKKIVNLCNKLSNFNWEKNKHKLIEIGQHNRECFLDLKNLFFNEYQHTSNAINQLIKLS